MYKKVLFIGLLLLSGCMLVKGQVYIRISQMGYLKEMPKIGVLLSSESLVFDDFEVRDARTDDVIFRGKCEPKDASRWGMKSAYRLNFTPLKKEGGYYIFTHGARSGYFRVGNEVYTSAADFPLHYMRQQRCSDNPYTKASCHMHDGIIVDHPSRSGEHIDVTGGWHDAADYLQYVTTSANATFQLMFAYSRNPAAFGDKYDARGRKGGNGIPDVLDEARWGLDWLLRMNPDSAVMFNQIADDRDHRLFVEPQMDSVDYGWGPGAERPVYFVTGKPQGLRKYKNRTTGVASTAGKFASAFAMGAYLFQSLDAEYAAILEKKAVEAFAFAEANPGVCQTASCVSPYFYEEDNYVDDMELAAATLHLLQPGKGWLKKADYWGTLEPITPWMETGKARHYQWYPFVNIGHYLIAQSGDIKLKVKYVAFMKEGLEHIRERAGEDPFMNGVPFLWCSNNFLIGALTQARLYHELTGDTEFLEMEASLRDWLFGCNPWGTSMICGMPQGGDFPAYPHSAFTKTAGGTTDGGLVDGPVYQYIYNNLLGIQLYRPDPYKDFQGGMAVYHDDLGDYSTNEPTMDGTASTAFYLSALQEIGKTSEKMGLVLDAYGAVVRMNPRVKKVYLVFTGDSLFEGAATVRKALAKQGVKGSFFLTGNCIRLHEKEVRALTKDGHFVGPHSDKHILYADWDQRSKSLVTADSLHKDLTANLKELKKAGVDLRNVKWMISPYEYYNEASCRALWQRGFLPLSFTSGTYSNADYTTPDMKHYRSSEEIMEKILKFEGTDPHGLNGVILLVHPGTEQARTDKFYNRLEELILRLKEKGYSFGDFHTK